MGWEIELAVGIMNGRWSLKRTAHEAVQEVQGPEEIAAFIAFKLGETGSRLEHHIQVLCDPYRHSDFHPRVSTSTGYSLCLSESNLRKFRLNMHLPVASITAKMARDCIMSTSSVSSSGVVDVVIISHAHRA